MKTLEEIKQAIHDYNLDKNKEAIMFMSATIVKEEEVEEGTQREMKLEFALMGQNRLILRALQQVIAQDSTVGLVFKQALETNRSLDLMLKLKELADALGYSENSEESDKPKD